MATRPPTRLTPTSEVPGTGQDATDFIVSLIDAGSDPITSAAAAGVLPADVRAWQREGMLTFDRLNAGAAWETDFTPFEQDCAVFAYRVNRAAGQAVNRLRLRAEQVARGGVEKKQRRTKSVNGQVVEAHEMVEHTLPDADMLRWLLERMAPDVYGQKASLSVAVVDLTDTPAVRDALAERFAAIESQLAVGSGDNT